MDLAFGVMLGVFLNRLPVKYYHVRGVLNYYRSRNLDSIKLKKDTGTLISENELATIKPPVSFDNFSRLPVLVWSFHSIIYI